MIDVASNPMAKETTDIQMKNLDNEESKDEKLGEKTQNVISHLVKGSEPESTSLPSFHSKAMLQQSSAP